MGLTDMGDKIGGLVVTVKFIFRFIPSSVKTKLIEIF